MKMAAGRPTVSLREITADSVKAIVRLSVSESQEDLVADNGCSIAQAHFDEKAWMRGIYADETPVGFVMLSIDRNKPEYYLWRFMIDEAHQGSGFGRRAMQLLIAWVPRGTQRHGVHLARHGSCQQRPRLLRVPGLRGDRRGRK